MSNENQMRQQLVTVAQRMAARGWVANHDGNLSLRLPRGRLLCTPSGVAKAALRPEMLLMLDPLGKVLGASGGLKPFSEINLHLAFYQGREDVGAVVHAHPPTATGFGVSPLTLDPPFLPEAVVSLGPSIPTVPLALPGEEAARALGPYVPEYDALLLAGNGVITCGVDLEMAYLRLELVEQLCQIALVAHRLGGVRPIPPPQLKPLLEARARAGLGPKGRGAPPPAPLAEASLEMGPGRRTGEDLERLVQAEIQRVLGRG
jgi:L-fuculose-phosphate aldolase